METNEIMTNEATTEVVEALVKDKNRLEIAAGVGAFGVLIVIAWEFALKPIGRKVKKAVSHKVTAIKRKKAEDDIDLDEMELDDIPEIDE